MHNNDCSLDHNEIAITCSSLFLMMLCTHIDDNYKFAIDFWPNSFPTKPSNFMGNLFRYNLITDVLIYFLHIF